MSTDLNLRLADMLKVGHNVSAFMLHCRVGQLPQLDITRVLFDKADVRELTARFELRELPGESDSQDLPCFDLDLLVRLAQRRMKLAIDQCAARHLREMAPAKLPKPRYPQIGDPQ